MNNNQEELPHTAITTWSGFVYQGKVALLHCLNLIHDFNKQVTKYQLKLENVDDFAIHYNNACLSMHQVKAYKSTKFNSYQVAIEKQAKESLKYPNVRAFFHVSREIENTPGNFPQLYPSVKLYEYCIDNKRQRYCGLNEIDNLLNDTIKDIYIKHYSEQTHKITDTYIDHSRNILENIVLNKVILVHHKIQTTPGNVVRKIAAEEYIGFIELFEILEKNITEVLLNDEYFLYALKKDIGRYYQEFYDELDQENGDIGDLKKLGNYLDRVNGLNIAEMSKFIRSILPHKKGTFKTLQDYKDETFTQDELKQGLFYILDQLVEANFNYFDDKPNLFSWVSNDKEYYPTAVSNARRSRRNICRKIVESAINNDVEFLYESGNLVTAEITSNNIFSDISNGPNANHENNQQLHNKFNHFKKISLISVYDVPQELLHESSNS
ncbi:ABC-three component system protein [Photobacterium kasasachensis]|uniref:ABC-three component system protein n=1 Tax=Photobacterium kasasachensis TaxID=2910240 RepID=UPI003D0C4956